MKKLILRGFKISLIVASMTISCFAQAELQSLIPESTIKKIAEETSGVSAKRNLDRVTLYHRTRASSQFDESAKFVHKQLKKYGFEKAVIRQYPADGKTMFGTQKSRPAWDVDFAELWILRLIDGNWIRDRRLASWDAVPLSVAQDSLSGKVTTTLVDIGAGVTDADYQNKDIKGKLVLTSSQPSSVVDKAVGELGAAGIISYAPNQKSAWWKEDDRLVRWGHIGSFPKNKSFAFMISLGEARLLQARLKEDETIKLHAEIKAKHYQGKYSLVDAAIQGNDPKVAQQEIILTCHLDHPRPGANDNASGCVSILEVARTLKSLIDKGLLPQPKRTIRFLWPAEIEGSLIYLTRRTDTQNIKANIHMDMVGGNQETKAVFRISGGPMSIPTFISDLGHQVGHFVNQQTEAFASGENIDYPLISTEGGKEPLMALMEGLSLGSDHQIFNSGSWKIPGLYLHDWPDRYIHTNFDTAAMIDPTKLKRAAFIGALNSWYLANMTEKEVPALIRLLKSNLLARTGSLLERIESVNAIDQSAMTKVHWLVEKQKIQSIRAFVEVSDKQIRDAEGFLNDLKNLIQLGKGVKKASKANNAKQITSVYQRNSNIKGTMQAFGYSYLAEHLAADKRLSLKLPNYSGRYGSGGDYTYEALNLVDGKRSVQEIHEWLVAELGPVPFEFVVDYLQALQSIRVISLTTE